MPNPPTVFGVTNQDTPWCLQGMITQIPSLAAAVQGIDPELLELSERQMETRLRQQEPGRKIDRVLQYLKIRFWEEFRRGQREKKFMELGNILEGVTTAQWWRRNILTNQVRLAWIITPPVEEMVIQKELLQIGMKRLREVMDLPLLEVRHKVLPDPNSEDPRKKKIVVEKKVNVALINTIHTIVMSMQDRVHGAVIQRQQIEARTLSVHANSDSAAVGEMSLEQMEAMEIKIKSLLNTIQEVTPVETLEGQIEGQEDVDGTQEDEDTEFEGAKGQ